MRLFVTLTMNITRIHYPRPSASPNNDVPRSDYDAKSDQHNMILGSIVLLLTLSSIVVAIMQWRQGRLSQQSNDLTIHVEMVDLGTLSIVR